MNKTSGIINIHEGSEEKPLIRNEQPNTTYYDKRGKVVKSKDTAMAITL